MSLRVPFPSLRRRFIGKFDPTRRSWIDKFSRSERRRLFGKTRPEETPREPDRLAAIRNADNQIVLVGVLSDDLSDGWVRLRAREGGIYAVPKSDVVFLDEPPR